MNSESLAERIQAECQSGASVSDIIEIFQAAQSEAAKDLRIMAEAVIEAHNKTCSNCPGDIDQGFCEAQKYKDGNGCACPACETARKIMEEQNGTY